MKPIVFFKKPKCQFIEKDYPMILLRYNVVVSPNETDAEEFVAWLNNNGHMGSIGTSDENFVNGRCTLTSQEAYAEFQELFAQHWRSEVK